MSSKFRSALLVAVLPLVLLAACDSNPNGPSGASEPVKDDGAPPPPLPKGKIGARIKEAKTVSP